MKKKNYTAPDMEKLSLDDDALSVVTGGDGYTIITDTNEGDGNGGNCNGNNFVVRHRNARTYSTTRGSGCEGAKSPVIRQY